ncbi:MAG: 1-deoxy-D-xylulose-5-phosphate reductoisomerase [Ectothiorhodospiraceae bacterium AqS1]|nr:1-deoxy-D-xylulose-5-phosphate reductoisomerase [Ectothiorhodospiraceae bacterium AqS1]
MKFLTVLGSTGSIGKSTLEVVDRNRSEFRVFALAAHSNAERMERQCRRFLPRHAVLVDAAAACDLRDRLSADHPEIEVSAGVEALVEIAAHPGADRVMAAITGAAGLAPTLAAVNAGKRILLANKESLVVAGGLLMDAAARSGADILPVDSEHNAIFQCIVGAGSKAGLSEREPGLRDNSLRGQNEPSSISSIAAIAAMASPKRIVLTASGGPFRDRPIDSLHRVQPEEACAHPNWSMGRKVSVDSATMMNKGLEVIEACRLFNLPIERVEVLIHPQSLIHSMVEYEDGSLLAQMGSPDMRIPIAHAMAWPARIPTGATPLDLAKAGRLDFEAPDFKRFPCLRLAYEAMRAGETAVIALNAANEIAVESFLDHRLSFDRIPKVIEETIARCRARLAKTPPADLESVLAVDAVARSEARAIVDGAGAIPDAALPSASDPSIPVNEPR